jgi:hypothetical protein
MLVYQRVHIDHTNFYQPYLVQDYLPTTSDTLTLVGFWQPGCAMREKFMSVRGLVSKLYVWVPHSTISGATLYCLFHFLSPVQTSILFHIFFSDIKSLINYQKTTQWCGKLVPCHPSHSFSVQSPLILRSSQAALDSLGLSVGCSAGKDTLW